MTAFMESRANSPNKCNECDVPIEKGDRVISLGLTWGGRSIGRVCADCIVKELTIGGVKV